MALITVKFEAAPDLILAIERLAAGLSLQQYRFLEQQDQMQEISATAEEVAPATHPAPVTAVQSAPIAVPKQQQINTVEQPAPVTPPVPATAVPTQEQTYTMEQLAIAGTQLVEAGRRNELQQLLASFGVQALTQLPKKQYGSFATQLRALGAKI